MVRIQSKWFVSTALAAVVGTVGCGDSATQPTDTASHADHDHAADGHEEHAHPAEGPHHGVLVELGAEEFHAEVVHENDAGGVTVYLLDSTAKEAVFSEATEIVINLKHGDKPEQYTLTAKTTEGQAAGKNSEYSLSSKELLDALHDESTTAKLSLTINGKPYAGTIEHADHADHSDHADHAH